VSAFDEAFFSERNMRDPVEPLAALLEEGSVHYSEILQGWAVLGFEDSRQVLKSRNIGRGDPLRALALSLPEEDFIRLHPLSDYWDRAIGNLDPPEHGPQRAAATQVFDAGIAGRIEPRLRGAVKEQLDVVTDSDCFDALENYALPITVQMICSLMGVRYSDRNLFVRWVERIFRYLGSPMNDPQLAEDCKDAYRSLGDYVSELLLEARSLSDPEATTLIGILAAPGADHGRSERDLKGMIVGMVQGGFETTSTLMSNTIATCLEDPDLKTRVVADHDFLGQVIDEVLRLAPSLKYAGLREVHADVELSNRVLKPGDRVHPVFLSANRDPREFPRPHVFDPLRRPNRHLSFGLGTHFCIGAPLAKLQTQIAVGEFFTCFPDATLAGPLAWRRSALLRRREAVPVMRTTSGD